MRPKTNVLLLAALACATFWIPTSVAAQDTFGRSVAVVDGSVLVSKPLVGVGSATVYVFGHDGSQWTQMDRLRAPGGSQRGEGFSNSMAWSGSMLAVASGDPDVRLAAHVFARSGSTWEAGSVAPLDPNASTPADSGPPEVTMATVMGILQPPQRTLAADQDWMAVGVLGSASASAPPVRVLRAEGEGWTLETELLPDAVGPRSRFGAALAMSDGVLAVGAPGYDGRGAVWVYRRGADGTWSEAGMLVDESSPVGGGLGSALLFASGRLWVGVPGSASQPGAVVTVPTTGSEAWTWGARLESPDGQARDGFGSAIAGDASEVWVGAPGYNEGRGGVVRFSPEDATPSPEWIDAGALQPGFGFGMSLAVSNGVGVVGAPLAMSGTGAAAAYVFSGGAWSAPTWLESGGALTTVAGEQIDCSDDGEAAGFDCDQVDLLAFLPLSALGAEPGERVSDIWGWTDPDTGREYTLVGRTAGMGIVDVTDATQPRFVGLVPANPSGARDIKVYQDHAFFTGDGAGNHGLVIFDLRRVRDVTGEPVDFEPDARYDGIASAHNLVLDPEAGFAYPVGASGGGETCGGGLHMVDIKDPLNPTFAGCFTDTEGLIWEGRTHDAQCTIYHGPDSQYEGREICFVSNETALRIVDVTDKANPVPLGSASYPGVAYIHQGWLSEDQQYFYLNDELDELVGTTERTRTLIWDVSELDDPVLASNYYGPNGATDHNLYIKGDRMYQANYQAGFRVMDISDPTAPVEIGFFDTTPYEGDPPGFVGAWTAFPYFESGTVVVSSMHEGLFLLKPRRRDLIP